MHKVGDLLLSDNRKLGIIDKVCSDNTVRYSITIYWFKENRKGLYSVEEANVYRANLDTRIQTIRSSV
jgi:hypothetical protein